MLLVVFCCLFSVIVVCVFILFLVMWFSEILVRFRFCCVVILVLRLWVLCVSGSVVWVCFSVWVNLLVCR